MRVKFGRSIRTARLKWRLLVLGTLGISKHLAAGRLVELSFYAGLTNRLEQPHCSERCYLTGVFRYIETDPHVALGAQIVNFIGRNRANDFIQRTCVVEVAINQPHLRFGIMRVLVDMIDAARVELA